MNTAVKEKWTKALRSGEFSQVTSSLKYMGGYCCLGVLCELYRRENPEESYWDSSDAFITRSSGESQVLPNAVVQWAELDWQNPITKEKMGLPEEGWDGESYYSLAELNDKNKPFSKIADIIERDL